MLGVIHKTARATGLPVRIIRHDLVPQCGPLGGIYTALKTTRAGAVLFLACDMPLVSAELMQFVLGKAAERIRKEASRKTKFRAGGTLFVRSHGRVGFPLLLPAHAYEAVRQRIESSDFSLQSLAKAVHATILTLKYPWTRQLFNINTPQDWASLRAILSLAD
jgi:molybdopterin-guanine dinucleotide biosynthesis protein A